MPAPPVLAAASAGLRRYLRELRASQAFLAGEVSHPGWLNLGQFRWRNVAPGRAARAAAGVLVPLAIGFATGHVEYGTFAALGALPAGMVSFQGVTRSRVLLVAIAAAGMAVSTFVGATTSASAPWLLVPVIMAWSYVAGSCAVLGPAAIVVSLQWPVAVLIASAIPLPAGQAAIRAGLVLAGGLWQGALVVSSWAVSRGSAERGAMAESYRALSDYASRLAAGEGGPPPPGRLPGSIALRDPNPLMRTAARRHLVDLMEEAERLRTTLTALGGRVGVDRGGSRSALLAVSGSALNEIAEALSARPTRRGESLDWARQILADHLAGQSWGWAGEALRGQLRSAVRMTERLNDAEPVRFGRPARRAAPGSTEPPSAAQPAIGPPATMRLPARDLLVTLRAGQGISSEAGRHALRLAVVVGLTEAIALAAGLPHGYWAALTALIVLRPDYGSTLYRGLQRAAGTALGAGLGVATVLLGHFGNWALLAGFGVCLLAAYAVLTVNYLLFAIFLTDFVVVLLALLGLPADQTAVDRLIGTCVGAGLALLAYLLWPTWERTAASEKFARLFLAQGRLADLLLHAYTRPASDEARQARRAKVIARRARVDAEASADRLADEPDRPPVTREFAQGLVSAGHRLALAGLAVEAAVAAQRVTARRSSPEAASPEAAGPRAGVPREAGQESPDQGAPGGQAAIAADSLQRQLDRFADAVRQASVQLAEALHRMQPPGPLPPLRELQVSIHREHGARGDSAALLTATDGEVDALNTAADIIRRQLGRGDAGQPG